MQKALESRSGLVPLAQRRWDHCPSCDHTRRTDYVTFDRVSFVRCGNCGLVYKHYEAVDIRSDDFYELNYFHGRKSGRDKRFEHRVRKSMRHIGLALRVQPVQRVLDVGCSFGYVMEAGQRLGLQAAGTDLSEYAVRVCKQRGYQARVGSLLHLPFADAAFDLVVMKHVLEHTPDPKLALREVRRVLRPGGLVMVMVPSLLYWKGRFLRRSYRYFRPDDLGSQHYFYCTPQTLGGLLQQADFEIVSSSKAFVRKRGWIQPWEWFRFASLWCWHALATQLLLQREAFALARPKP